MYPLLMFVSLTAVCPEKPLPFAVSSTVEGVKAMAWGSSCRALAFASSSSAYSKTCSYPLFARIEFGFALRLVKLYDSASPCSESQKRMAFAVACRASSSVNPLGLLLGYPYIRMLFSPDNVLAEKTDEGDVAV